MNVLDLFSGIGGFSLGLERAGFKTVAFCEIAPVARKVLRKHWPNIPIYEDIRKLTYEKLQADGITDIQVICGGFPCQDISIAGKGAGIEGERSGLWTEMARLVGEIRPRYAVVENVAALRNRGLSRVLGDLAEIGYDAEWHCIPASAVGAPHQRDRLWIIAYPDGKGKLQQKRSKSLFWRWLDNSLKEYVADIDVSRLSGRMQAGEDKKYAADLKKGGRFAKSHKIFVSAYHRDPQPFLGGKVHGVSGKLDPGRGRAKRISLLGNAVVPQIPELIGRAILEREKYKRREYVDSCKQRDNGKGNNHQGRGGM